MWFSGCKNALKYVCSWGWSSWRSLQCSPKITIITIIFGCDNLWKSKLMALEKPGKLQNFFSYFVANGLPWPYCILRYWKGLRGDKVCISFRVNPSQSCRVSPAVWYQAVLPAIWHRWTHPVLIPPKQANTQLTYPSGMEGWVDLGVGYISR